MTLLDQRALNHIRAVGIARADRVTDAIRRVMFRPGNVPPGMKRIETPEEKARLRRYLERQRNREERGFIPGNINTTVSEHPAVQQMLEEAPDA